MILIEHLPNFNSQKRIPAVPSRRIPHPSHPPFHPSTLLLLTSSSNFSLLTSPKNSQPIIKRRPPIKRSQRPPQPRRLQRPYQTLRRRIMHRSRLHPPQPIRHPIAPPRHREPPPPRLQPTANHQHPSQPHPPRRRRQQSRLLHRRKILQNIQNRHRPHMLRQALPRIPR